MRARPFGRHGDRDSGFTMIEVVVSLVLLALIMSGVIGLFVRMLHSSSGIQGRQAAVPVANQALDFARSIPALRDGTGNSKLIAGRYQTSVTAQWAAAASISGVDMSGMYATWDTTATATSTPNLPLTTTVLVSGKSYSVQTLIGVCYRTGVNSPCTKVSGYATPPAVLPAGKVALYRVIVAVTFTTPGDSCSSGCTYVASTLIDPSSDPTFNTNETLLPPPIALSDSVTLDASAAGTAANVPVLGNDSGTFGSYPVVLGVAPTKGVVTITSTGIVTYTSNPGASGTDFFTYYLKDATGVASAPATVSVTINPRASADGATTGKARTVTMNLKANDIGTYPTTGTSCITITDPPNNGSIALGTCGSITYTPNSSFTGTDSFNYIITDNSALDSNEVTATITVYPPPTAVADSATTNATVPITIPVQGNDTLPAGSATTSIVTSSSNGTATVSGGNVIFSPNANYSGTTSFTYNLTDVYANTSSTVTVTVVVKPTAVALPASGTGVGKSVASTVTSYINGAFSGSYLTATSAAGSTVTASGATLTYTPKPGFTGNDTVTYTVTDTSGQTASSTWTVSVAAAPTAVNDAASTVGTTTKTVAVTANDSVPGGIASVSVVTGPSSGTAVVSGTSINYTAPLGFSGTVTFTYKVTDTYGNTGTATVTMTVTKPAVPTGVNDTGTVKKNTGAGVTISVLANDTYPGGVASIAIVTGPTTGTASVQGSGASSTIKYVPTATTGTFTFTYRITDLYGQLSAAITVTVTVTN
jgi:large repetitive protein